MSICLEDRNVFARFDEIPSMNLVREKMCIFTKAMALLRITKRNYSNSMGP